MQYGKLDISEKEYRKLPGLNFSKLAAFYNKGINSPDHALLEVKFKSYFEFGKMFETLIQDMAKGSNEFEKRFFQSTVKGNMPDDMIRWIDEKEDLEQFYVWTKKGDLSKTFKTRHDFLDEAQENPGKIPVSTKDWDLLQRLTENMMKMPYQGVPVGDLLAKADFQVPLRWKDEITGLEKKALVDCLLDLGSEFIPFDIKTTADFRRFSYMLRDKCFIQNFQYVEGVNACCGPAISMPFLVASKEAPFLCQSWLCDFGDSEWACNAHDTYQQLCRDYAAWDGKPRGYLPLQRQKFYFKEAVS